MTISPSFTPDWPTCQHPATPACTGIQIPDSVKCLAHLTQEERASFLARLQSTGRNLDVRGTVITPDLLEQVTTAVQVQNGDSRQFGNIDSRHAQFTGDANFTKTIVAGHAQFSGARFSGAATFTQAHLNQATFNNAQFVGPATFNEALFKGEAIFEQAKFGSEATFSKATFQGLANFKKTETLGSVAFDHARFDAEALFSNAMIVGTAKFYDVTFERRARFDSAHFGLHASFIAAQFLGGCWFSKVQFDRDATFAFATLSSASGFNEIRCHGVISFDGIRFEIMNLGPIVADGVSLNRASFTKPVVIAVETSALSCADTRFEAGVELRARYAIIRMDQATFGAPSSLVAASSLVTAAESFRHPPVLFAATTRQIEAWTETTSSLRSPRSRGQRSELDASVPTLLSLRGSDLANLTVTDVDLSWCHFAGAHHLDQLRIEGRTAFGRPPQGWRWTSRQALAEEHQWRAAREHRSGWSAETPLRRGWPGWDLGWRQPDPITPERLAALNRSLRKALEDGKNEASAGDFYYAETDARRHSPSTHPVERIILFGYWLISGYGQRATRALGALITLLVVATVILVGWGLPAATAGQQMSGAIHSAPAGRPEAVTITITSPATALPPASQRWTWQRTNTAATIALDAMVFRDTSQTLTVAGGWTDRIARLLGPTFLALAVLAVRARVKR